MSTSKRKFDIIDSLMGHSKKIITVFVALVVISSILFVGGKIYLKKFGPVAGDPNVVAEVNGEKIYLKEYKERLFGATSVGTPENPGLLNESIKEPVLDELIELRVVKKELAQRNIEITDDELTQEAKKVYKDYDKSDESAQKAFKNYLKLKVGKDKLLSNVMTWREGFALYCRFDRAYDADMQTNPASAQALLVKQTAYAGDYCQKAKSRLESGKSDYDNELTQLKADSVIGEAAWKPAYISFGDKFDQKSFTTGFKSGLDFLDQLKKLDYNKSGYYLVDVKRLTSKQGNMDQGGAKKITEVEAGTKVALALIYLDGKGNNGQSVNFDEWIQEKVNQLSTKKYIERIKI